MAIQTFADTKNEQNGVTVLKVAAGECKLGESIDITAAELTALSPTFDLRAGTVTVTPVKSTVWKRKS